MVGLMQRRAWVAVVLGTVIGAGAIEACVSPTSGAPDNDAGEPVPGQDASEPSNDAGGDATISLDAAGPADSGIADATAPQPDVVQSDGSADVAQDTSVADSSEPDAADAAGPDAADASAAADAGPVFTHYVFFAGAAKVESFGIDSLDGRSHADQSVARRWRQHLPGDVRRLDRRGPHAERAVPLRGRRWVRGRRVPGAARGAPRAHRRVSGGRFCDAGLPRRDRRPMGRGDLELRLHGERGRELRVALLDRGRRRLSRRSETCRCHQGGSPRPWRSIRRGPSSSGSTTCSVRSRSSRLMAQEGSRRSSRTTADRRTSRRPGTPSWGRAPYAPHALRDRWVAVERDHAARLQRRRSPVGRRPGHERGRRTAARRRTRSGSP